MFGFLKKWFQKKSIELKEETISIESKGFSERFLASSYHGTNEAGLVEVLTDRGSHGELLLCNELDKLPFVKKVLVNLYLFDDRGASTEIDAICLTQKGIFVIENKNYSGAVYGEEKYKNWLEYMGKQRYEFYSPILQNQAHVKGLLRQFPALVEIPIFSIIVFSNRCKLNVKLCSVPVIHRNVLCETMSTICEAKRNVFSLQDLDALYESLYVCCKQDETVKAAHIQRVRSIKAGLN